MSLVQWHYLKVSRPQITVVPLELVILFFCCQKNEAADFRLASQPFSGWDVFLSPTWKNHPWKLICDEVTSFHCLRVGFLFTSCNKTYLRTHLIFRGPLGCYDHYDPRSCGPRGSIPSQGRSCWSSSRAHRSWRFWAHFRGIWSDKKCPNTWRGMGKAMNMVLGWKASTELMSYFCSQPSWFGVCCLSNFAILSDHWQISQNL